MSEVLRRVQYATGVAAAGPLAGDRERPELPPLPRDPTLDPAQAPSAFVERFRAELETLTGPRIRTSRRRGRSGRPSCGC